MKKSKNYLGDAFIKIYSLFQKSSLLKKLKSIMYYFDRIIMLFIKKPKYKESSKKKILIIYNLAFGDGIVFLNALKNIRNIYPQDNYEITISIQKGLEKIYDSTKLFDRIIQLDYNKSTVNIKERIKTIKKINDTYYDIVLDPVGANECLTNVLMTRNAKGKEKIGCVFTEYEKSCSKHIVKKTYNTIKTINEKTLIEQYYSFFYDKYNVEYCELPKKEFTGALPNNYFLVFPSASMELKKWPLDRYAEIINRIYEKTKYSLVLCGTKVDKEDCDQLQVLLDKKIPVINLIGKTNLLEFISIIEKANFVITNDTSTYHISVVNQTPVTIISGSYTYDRYVSYDFKGCSKYIKPYIAAKKMDCMNCYNKCSKIKKNDKLWPCLSAISTDDAWKVINRMIDETREDYGIKPNRKNK